MARAQNPAGGGPTPPRLGFINGEVSFWRTGAEDWSQAQVNTALASGDALYAGDGANLELQVGPRAFIRAGAATELDLTSLDPGYMQFRMTGGHAALDLKNLPGGQIIELDTPNAAFTIDRPGYFRLDVDENTTAFSARRGGTATAVPAAGAATPVAEDSQIILTGTDQVQVSMNAAPAPDEWDRWNADRTARLSETPRSAQYVAPEVAGVDDLDSYGDWREESRYGHVWVPRDVPADWAPYTTGRWVYDPVYDWTWVDESPWGWAPYHYGRWVSFGGVWGWAPGPVVVAPVYSPALVAFFGAPGIGVSVSVGLPFVSWCALGFGEPIVPWWGGVGFVGRPFWGGWGGPRIVNNQVINNTTIVNVTNITNYQNVNIRNAVVGVDRNQFGRGRVEQVRLDAARVQHLQPVHGNLQVRPVAASFVPREARGQRPPERLQTRQVVATRPPQDPVSRLRSQGIQAAPVVKRPEPRIVRAQPARGGAGAPPPAGGRAVAPGPAGRQQPPPPPGAPRPGGGGAAPLQRPARPERPQPGAAGRPMPPPPPGGGSAPQRQPGRAAPPPPAPGGGGAGRPERPVRPQPPAREQAVPQRPARPQAPAREQAAPQRPVRPQAPAQERVAPQQPARPQAPARERVAPQQPARPQAPAHERVAPQQPARPQAPAPERVAPRQPARPQAPPRERVAPQQPARPQAPPRAAQPQPPGKRPAPAERKPEHEPPR